MAQATKATKSRPGRSLAGMAVLIIALYLGVFFGKSATPALGLDLRGGTQVTLTAQPLNTTGGKITKSALEQAVAIIRSRVNGIGVGGAEISTQGGNHIVVSVPGKGRDQVVKTVGQTALLRFRQVLEVGSYTPTPTATPSVSASPSGKTTGKSGSTPSKKTSKKSHGDVLSSALLAKPKPSATPTPSATPSATPTASVAPTPTSSTASSSNADQPLPNSEAPTLTTALTQAFASWDCAKNPNPTNGNDNPADYVISCDAPGTQGGPALKYLLAPAAVEGTDLKTASAGLDSNGVGWQVNLQFTGSGAGKWLNVTKAAYNATGSTSSGFGTCAPPKGCNSVAIVLDGTVQSAPAIQSAGGIPGGIAQITGNFSQTEANNLADVLKYGSLPLKFIQSDVTTVSATLGSQQLRGGLIAGAIGLALVILFSLVYYRALGLVTVGSLLVSGLILYAVTTLLGHSSVGYTLSLPGIAGFIVAVGITADSFVVYFERLRDEIREGRRLRSAVERAWPRARRTILSADTVSLLAAVILYIVSIGDVRGFAFTLGLSTLSDLLIVFFFTKPLLIVLGRRPAFDSGKAWTGIGRARVGVDRDTEPDGPRRRVRGKES